MRKSEANWLGGFISRDSYSMGPSHVASREVNTGKVAGLRSVVLRGSIQDVLVRPSLVEADAWGAGPRRLLGGAAAPPVGAGPAVLALARAAAAPRARGEAVGVAPAPRPRPRVGERGRGRGGGHGIHSARGGTGGSGCGGAGAA